MARAVVLRGASAWLSLTGVALWLGYVANAQTNARPAQTGTQTAPASELLSVNVVHVKPDLLTEWEEFQTKEVIPTLQKGGIKQRDAWRTVVGESFECAFVSPLANFAVRDEPNPIVKALGEDGARAYGMKNRRLITGSRTYVIRTRPDLSYAPQMSGPPKLAVLSIVSVAAGRTADYENYIKADVLPLQKQAQTLGYLVSQTLFGGDGNEFVSLTLVNAFADLDKGSPAVRVLGAEGAAKLFAKVAGIVTHTERFITRYDPGLSFKVGTSTEAK